MDVIFASTNPKQNRIGPIMHGNKELVLNKGFIKTTDKDEVRTLLEHSFYARGRYELVSDPELVGDYLDNDEEPDYITMEYLVNVSNDTIKKIGKVAGTRNEVPALIKAELRNQPVTSQISEIVKAEIEAGEKKSTTKKEDEKESTTKKKSTSGAKKKKTTK